MKVKKIQKKIIEVCPKCGIKLAWDECKHCGFNTNIHKPYHGIFVEEEIYLVSKKIKK